MVWKPSQMSRLGVFQSEQKKRQFLDHLHGELLKRGIVDVLHNGIKIYPVNLITFYLAPTENNKEGAMADDTIWDYIEDYTAGKISQEAFWALAKSKYLTHWIVFCTEKTLGTSDRYP